MKQAYRIAFLLALASVLSLNAWADMDYTCLKQCMGNGGGTYACNSQCSYAIVKTKKGDLIKNGEISIRNGQLVKKRDPHKQFSDMHIGNKLLTPPAATGKHSTPGKDYQCEAQCLQTHMSYALCQEQCVKQDTLVPAVSMGR